MVAQAGEQLGAAKARVLGNCFDRVAPKRMLEVAGRNLVVLTGADPAFCAGDDVRAIMGGGEVRERKRHVPRLTPAADALLRR